MLKYPYKSNLGEESPGLGHSLEVQSVMALKLSWQGYEAAGHIVPVISKQTAANVVLSSPLPFVQSRATASGTVPSDNVSPHPER